ncbi:YrdC domain-containing protein, mitochondrial [Takifugu flavidus]|uniref:Threonylcarbamoyl-AMP synthase n=1 Tax=Takifugu flavidus TaxID=433684 RepID=A0A5C6PP69_9TELE|nr:YrdC domain-containing protein, mitochondrial [Takifugu flavidus]
MESPVGTLSSVRPREVTFLVPKTNFHNRGSERQGPRLGPPPNPHCTGPFMLLLQVVGPLGTPGTGNRAPAPGLTPGWGPGNPLGRVYGFSLRCSMMGLMNNCKNVDDDNDDKILSWTKKCLKEGHVVALPTDTIYGLACLAQNSEAIRKIYDIKGRNQQKPLAICVGQIQDVYNYCNVLVQKSLLHDLLPGPVTLVFERSDVLNTDLNPFTSLVGVRIPQHDFMRRLCQMCGEPLALTSANISSHTSTVAVHEFQELWPNLAVVVDGGPVGGQSRLGSTVVDLSVRGKYHIIRQGWWTAFSDGTYSTKGLSPTEAAALEERVKQMELEDMCNWRKAKEESQV